MSNVKGIVIASHGDLAEGMLDAMHLLTGDQEAVCAVGLKPGSSPEEFREKLSKAIDEVDQGEGVLVLVDLFGGTPSNSTALLFGREDLRAVAGVNLPMLLEVVLDRDGVDLDALADEAAAFGAQGVIDIRKRILAAAADDEDEDF